MSCCFVPVFTLKKRDKGGGGVLRVVDSFSFRHMLWLLPWVLPSWVAFVSLLHHSLSPDCISRLEVAVYLHLAMSSPCSDRWSADRSTGLSTMSERSRHLDLITSCHIHKPREYEGKTCPHKSVCPSWAADGSVAWVQHSLLMTQSCQQTASRQSDQRVRALHCRLFTN